MPLTQTGLWQFRARGGDALGGLSEFIYRNVNVTPAAPIVVSISADSSSIVSGQSTIARSTATPTGEIAYHGLEARLLPSGPWTNWRVWNDSGGLQQSTSVTPATGSYELRAYAARADGASTYSSSITLNVQGPPVIVTHPTSQSANSGQPVTLSVSVTGTAPISYQWRKNGVNISGATNASLAFSAVSTSDAANAPGYTVVVTNPHGNVTSNPAVLTVSTMPPVRLALQYWQPGDYPHRETGGQYEWREDVYHEAECHTEWQCHDWDGDGEDDTCGDEEVCSGGGTWPDWVWVPDYAEDGFYGSRWDTTIGTFGHPLSTDTAAFRSWATGRGHALQSYPFAYEYQRFRVWASAPGGNCNNFSAALYSPSNTFMGSWSFGSGGYSDIDLPRWYGNGFYRVDVSFSGATGTTPSSGTVSYYISLGVGLPPTISSSFVASVNSGANLSYTINAPGAYSFWASGLPNGIVVNSSNGALSGSTIQLGTHYITISATNGAGTTSAVLVLSVNVSPPVITAQPVGKTGKPGSTVQLTVQAASDSAPQFQWKKNGIPMSAANNRVGIASDQLMLTELRPSDAALYSVDVSNSSGTVTSQQAQLSVDPVPTPPPSITTQPLSLVRTAGQSATFTVVATGAGELRFQWFKNGNAIADATQSSYSLLNAQVGDSAIYNVEVFNDFGSVDSSCAALVVGSLTAAPQSVALTYAVDFDVPLVLDYPLLSPPLPGNVATNWSATGLPTGLDMNAVGRISGKPTTAGFFTGSVTASNNVGSTTRTITLNVMTVNDAPWIPYPPVSVSVLQYEPFSLDVFAGSVEARPVSFQWRKDGVNLPDQTSRQLYVASAQPSDAGIYTVVASSTYNFSVLSTTSSPASVTVNTTGNIGSPAAATIQFPIIVTRPNGTQTQINSSATVVPNAATVGDTITVTARATDVDGDLAFLQIRTFSPHPANPATRGYWSHDDALNWVAVGGSVFSGNPLVCYYPQDENNQTNPVARTVTFVVDSPGTWKIRIESGDTNNQRALSSISNSIDLAVSNPVLNHDSAITHATRLVGAYINAGQSHRDWPEMWRPPTGRWTFKWGPNAVFPLKLNWASPATPSENITLRHYLGYHDKTNASFPTPTAAEEEAVARDLAAELTYAGVDFVIIDHTNLVFFYGTDPTTTFWAFTNTENEVIRAARSLKNGFQAYALAKGTPRIRMTYLLGMTTAWYRSGMNGAHPALKLVPAETGLSEASNKTFIANRTRDFNALVQYLYNNYASDPNVWQWENGKPLLLLYVGTDGPAAHRIDSTALFDEAIINDVNSPDGFGFKITVGGIEKRITEVFTIKYTAALSSSRPPVRVNPNDLNSPEVPNDPQNILRNSISEVRTFGSVTRRFYKKHWTFREYPSVPMGTLNAAGDAAECIHVTGYRSTTTFENELGDAVALKPKFLTIAAWNEFGSGSDEPSPDDSWTVMPNNKFGRRYTEIMRQKVHAYKSAP
jgi:hypothetical protein